MKRSWLFLCLCVVGCSFTSDLSAYCERTGSCRCTAGLCCVVEGAACEPGVANCCVGNCSAGVCRSGADAGQPDAGQPDAGAVDAGVVDAGQVDAGPVDAGEEDAGLDRTARGVVIPGRDVGNLFDYGSDCRSGLIKPVFFRDGGFVDQPCCAPGDGGCACTLPGHRRSSSGQCCFQDANTDNTTRAVYCPLPVRSRIDETVTLVQMQIASWDGEVTCAGFRAALGGCCNPSNGNCEFTPMGVCALDNEPGGMNNPCCYVAGAPPFGASAPTVYNDCRVTGACVCGDGRCERTPGSVCLNGN